MSLNYCGIRSSKQLMAFRSALQLLLITNLDHLIGQLRSELRLALILSFSQQLTCHGFYAF